MKKLNTCDFLILGIGILAVCFSISFIANCKLNLETDFLSAAATLFAAVVAIVLFSDWRDQFKVSLVKESTTEFESEAFVFYKTYLTLRTFTLTVNQKSDNEALKLEYADKWSNFLFSVDQVLLRLRKLIEYLSKLKNTQETALTKLRGIQKELEDLRSDLERYDPNSAFMKSIFNLHTKFTLKEYDELVLNIYEKVANYANQSLLDELNNK